MIDVDVALDSLVAVAVPSDELEPAGGDSDHAQEKQPWRQRWMFVSP
jgi:hypothetical protein